MEQYELETTNSKIPVKWGYYKNKVNQKHVNAYGDISANKILETVTSIVSRSFSQKEDINTTVRASVYV